MRSKTLDDLLADTYLRDIVERNLQVAAQCCIDISGRIISIENAPRPADGYESLLRMGELGVVPMDFARQLAPLSGFRNILVYEYMDINWNQVFRNLQRLDDLARFAGAVRHWLDSRPAA
jgi:uncharacterized protein YutE (UPF0331/DUF86 family)